MRQSLPAWATETAVAKIQSMTNRIHKLADGYRKVGLSFVRPNNKTAASLDVDAKCHHACAYCYSKNAPAFMKAGRATDGVFYDPHTQWDAEHKSLFAGFLRQHKKVLPGFFLRIFAHSDYKVEHRTFWTEVLTLAAEAGVRTVIFTKTRECVDHLAPHATRILISRDNSNRWGFDSPEWVSSNQIVDQYMATYPNVFRVGMVVDEQDVQEVEADFYIAHHGSRVGLTITKPLTQEALIDIVGRKHACTPTGRCIGCTARCTISMTTPRIKP
jgi:L-rhamnose mutarotase